MRTARVRRKRRLAVMAVILSVSMVFNSVSAAYGAWSAYREIAEQLHGSSMGIRSWIYLNEDEEDNYLGDSAASTTFDAVRMSEASSMHGKVQNTGGLNAAVRASVDAELYLDDENFSYALTGGAQGTAVALSTTAGGEPNATPSVSVASYDTTKWEKIASTSGSDAGTEYYYYKGKLGTGTSDSTAELFSALSIDDSATTIDSYLVTADASHSAIYMLEDGASFVEGGQTRHFTTDATAVAGLVPAQLSLLAHTTASQLTYRDDFGDVNGDGKIDSADARITGDADNGHTYADDEKLAVADGFDSLLIRATIHAESTQAIKGAPKAEWGLTDAQVTSIYGGTMTWDTYDNKSDLQPVTATFSGSTSGASLASDQLPVSSFDLTDVVPGYVQFQRVTAANNGTGAKKMGFEVYLDERSVNVATADADAYNDMLSKIRVSLYDTKAQATADTPVDGYTLTGTHLVSMADDGGVLNDTGLTYLGAFSFGDSVAAGSTVTKIVGVRYNTDATTYYDGSAEGSMPNILLVAVSDDATPVSQDFGVQASWGSDGYKDVAYRGITESEIASLTSNVKVTFVSDRDGDGCTGHYDPMPSVIYVDTPEGVQAVDIVPVYGNGASGGITELIVTPYLMTQDVATNMPANKTTGDATKYFKPSVVNEISVNTASAPQVSIVPNVDGKGGEIHGVLDTNGTVVIEGGYVDNQTSSPTYGSVAVPDGVTQVKTEVTYKWSGTDYAKDAAGNLVIEKIKFVPVAWEGTSASMKQGDTANATTITVKNGGRTSLTLVSDGTVDNDAGTVTFTGTAATSIKVEGGYVNKAGELIIPEDVTKATVSATRDTSGTITGYVITYDRLGTEGSGSKLTTPAVRLMDEDNKPVVEGPTRDSYAGYGDPIEVRGAVELLLEESLNGQDHTAIIVTEGVTKAHLEPEYNRDSTGAIITTDGVKSIEYVNVVPTNWAGTRDGLDKDDGASGTTILVKNMDGETVELATLGSGTVTGTSKNQVVYTADLYNNPSTDPDKIDITIDGGYRDHDGNIILPPGAQKAEIEAIYNDAGDITGFRLVVTEWEGDADRADTRTYTDRITLKSVIDENGDTVPATYPYGNLTGTVNTETIVVEGGRLDSDGNLVLPGGVTAAKILVERNDPSDTNAITKIVVLHTERESAGQSGGQVVSTGSLDTDGKIKVERRDGTTTNPDLLLTGKDANKDFRNLLSEEVTVIGEELRVGAEGMIYVPDGVIEAEVLVNTNTGTNPNTIRIIPTRWQSDGETETKTALENIVTVKSTTESTLTPSLRHQDRSTIDNVTANPYTGNFVLADDLIITGGYLGYDGKIVLPDNVSSATVRVLRSTTDAATGVTTVQEITIDPYEVVVPKGKIDEDKPFLIDRNEIEVAQVPGITSTSSRVATRDGNRTISAADLADSVTVIGARFVDGQLMVSAGVKQARIDVISTNRAGKITKFAVVPTRWVDDYADGDTSVTYNNKVALNSSGRPSVVDSKGDPVPDANVFPAGSFGTLPASGLTIVGGYVNDYNEIVVPADAEDVIFTGAGGSGTVEKLVVNVRQSITSAASGTNPIRYTILDDEIPVVKKTNGTTVADYNFKNVTDSPQHAALAYMLTTDKSSIEKDDIVDITVADTIDVYASAAAGSTGNMSAYINEAGEIIVPDGIDISSEPWVTITYELKAGSADGSYQVIAIHVGAKVTEDTTPSTYYMLARNERNTSQTNIVTASGKVVRDDSRTLELLKDANIDATSGYELVNATVDAEGNIVVPDGVTAASVDVIYDTTDANLIKKVVVNYTQSDTTRDNTGAVNTSLPVRNEQGTTVTVTRVGDFTASDLADASKLIIEGGRIVDGSIVVPEGVTSAQMRGFDNDGDGKIETIVVTDTTTTTHENVITATAAKADLTHAISKNEGENTTCGLQFVDVTGMPVKDRSTTAIDASKLGSTVTIVGGYLDPDTHNIVVPDGVTGVVCVGVADASGTISKIVVTPTNRMADDLALEATLASGAGGASALPKVKTASGSDVTVVVDPSFTVADLETVVRVKGATVNEQGVIIVPDGTTQVRVTPLDTDKDNDGKYDTVAVTVTTGSTAVTPVSGGSGSSGLVLRDASGNPVTDESTTAIDLSKLSGTVAVVGANVDANGHVILPNGTLAAKVVAVVGSSGKIERLEVTPTRSAANGDTMARNSSTQQPRIVNEDGQAVTIDAGSGLSAADLANLIDIVTVKGAKLVAPDGTIVMPSGTTNVTLAVDDRYAGDPAAPKVLTVTDTTPTAPPKGTPVSDINPAIGPVYTGLTKLTLPIDGSDELYVRDASTASEAKWFKYDDFEDYVEIVFDGPNAAGANGSLKNGYFTYPAGTTAVKLSFEKDAGHDKYNRIVSTIVTDTPAGTVINPWKTDGGLAESDTNPSHLSLVTVSGGTVKDITLTQTASGDVLGKAVEFVKGNLNGDSFTAGTLSYSTQIVAVRVDEDGTTTYTSDVALDDAGNLVFPDGTVRAAVSTEDLNGDGETDAIVVAYMNWEDATPIPVDPTDPTDPTNPIDGASSGGGNTLIRTSGTGTGGSTTTKTTSPKTGDPMRNVVVHTVLAALSGIGLIVVARELRRLDAAPAPARRRARRRAA